MPSSDPFDLERFVSAQKPVFETALAELQGGRKRSHWMWFVFPQMRGLGRSTTAEFYGIASRAEAAAYLAHPLLGIRLQTATDVVLSHRDANAHAIFGSPDDMKFRSSMTLFARIDSDGPYRAALDVLFHGDEDKTTIHLLERSAAL